MRGIWRYVLLVAALSVLCSGTRLRAQVDPDSGSTYSYANTPKILQPYRRFHGSYRTFFRKPMPFRGTGPSRPAPRHLDSVRIGLLAPLKKDPDAGLGRAFLRGARIALEEANTEGGYRGTPFQLVVRNEGGTWGAASDKMVELIDRGVWAVLGSVGGASIHIAIRVALKAEIPVVIAGATDPTLTETRIPWVIRVNADDRQLGYALALRIFEVDGIDRVAILRDNDRYGRTGIEEFQEAARLLGHPVLVERRYVEGDTSFTSQLRHIARSRAGAVVIWGDADEAGHAVSQMDEMDLDLPVYGSSRLVSDRFLRIAGEAANGVVAAASFNPTLERPVLGRFQRTYENRYGRTPPGVAAHGYDGMRLIIAGIREKGLDRIRIRHWLTDRKTVRGATGRIVFDATWNDVGPVWLARVRNGTFTYQSSPLDR